MVKAAIRRIAAQNWGSVDLVHLVYLVCLVGLVDEVHLVYLVCPVGLARAIS